MNFKSLNDMNERDLKSGIITDIQRCSVHDGPGIRTTVFFKGCPLNCKWCHNPENIGFEPETMLYPEKCIGCGQCEKGCFSGARVLCGREMTSKEVLNQVAMDIDYYGKEGGVTFSGGEPFAQPEFLKELVLLSKDMGINTAVETCLIYYNEEIFKMLDLVMADLKIWDDKIHKEYTGVLNKSIKENFKRLNALGVPIIARTPVICGIDQGIDRISDFLKGLENVKKYELLPYHPLGESKREALEKERERFEIPTKNYMKELEKYVFIR